MLLHRDVKLDNILLFGASLWPMSNARTKPFDLDALHSHALDVTPISMTPVNNHIIMLPL